MKEKEEAKRLIELEGILQTLDGLGETLYIKFGTDSYNERCVVHDLKEEVKKQIESYGR